MPFTKENARELQAKGVEARIEKRENLWEFLAGGGARKYHEKLDNLSNGVELSKPEEQFMDRVEKMTPYIKARKTDVTTDGEKIQVQPILGGMTEKEEDK